ncbi:MAG: hypothetical protein JJU45_09455 [Acidimicrobiia bacterium]|nr:hypothetical protein [Acidimicrobiia bacterium]
MTSIDDRGRRAGADLRRAADHTAGPPLGQLADRRRRSAQRLTAVGVVVVLMAAGAVVLAQPDSSGQALDVGTPELDAGLADAPEVDPQPGDVASPDGGDSGRDAVGNGGGGDRPQGTTTPVAEGGSSATTPGRTVDGRSVPSTTLRSGSPTSTAPASDSSLSTSPGTTPGDSSSPPTTAPPGSTPGEPSPPTTVPPTTVPPPTVPPTTVPPTTVPPTTAPPTTVPPTTVPPSAWVASCAAAERLLAAASAVDQGTSNDIVGVALLFLEASASLPTGVAAAEVAYTAQLVSAIENGTSVAPLAGDFTANAETLAFELGVGCGYPGGLPLPASTIPQIFTLVFELGLF